MLHKKNAAGGWFPYVYSLPAASVLISFKE